MTPNNSPFSSPCNALVSPCFAKPRYPHVPSSISHLPLSGHVPPPPFNLEPWPAIATGQKSNARRAPPMSNAEPSFPSLPRKSPWPPGWAGVTRVSTRGSAPPSPLPARSPCRSTTSTAPSKRAPANSRGVVRLRRSPTKAMDPAESPSWSKPKPITKTEPPPKSATSSPSTAAISAAPTPSPGCFAAGVSFSWKMPTRMLPWKPLSRPVPTMSAPPATAPLRSSAPRTGSTPWTRPSAPKT